MNRHLRLVGPDERAPEPPVEAQEQLFEAPKRTDILPPDVRHMADELHDRGHIDLAKLMVIQYCRFERVRKYAAAVLTDPEGDGAA